MAKKQRPKFITVTDDMKQRIVRMATNTWQSIAMDVLMCGDEGEATVMDREEVIEVVSDADYMNMYGNDREAYKFWDSLCHEQKMQLVGNAFQHSHYGA